MTHRITRRTARRCNKTHWLPVLPVSSAYSTALGARTGSDFRLVLPFLVGFNTIGSSCANISSPYSSSSSSDTEPSPVVLETAVFRCFGAGEAPSFCQPRCTKGKEMYWEVQYLLTCAWPLALSCSPSAAFHGEVMGGGELSI